ncbi:DUF6499 domain-containing protein [Sphingobium sp.]|uniref:transcriptional regulator domain-containing protein n=1 Tax=Sphingobium sp. TaxID=1912891 RepID=UPI000DB1B38D|nr:DUF6499 domain-containing protein [Sphingobium sp.]PZU68695.1 MAG: hypothetical protein DI540_08065 [Sphingobium sp.]
MKPDISGWKDQKRYKFFDTLTVEGLAWECLRRHEPYQNAYRNLVRANQASTPLSIELERQWGLRFPGSTKFICARTAHNLVA